MRARVRSNHFEWSVGHFKWSVGQDTPLGGVRPDCPTRGLPAGAVVAGVAGVFLIVAPGFQTPSNRDNNKGDPGHPGQAGHARESEGRKRRAGSLPTYAVDRAAVSRWTRRQENRFSWRAPFAGSSIAGFQTSLDFRRRLNR